MGPVDTNLETMMSNWRVQNLIGAAGIAALCGALYGIYKLSIWIYQQF
jgi:hypothetical protein